MYLESYEPGGSKTRRPGSHNLEVIRWGREYYIVPLDRVSSSDMTTICTRGEVNPNPPGRLERFLRGMDRPGSDWHQDKLEKLARDADFVLLPGDDYEAFERFKKAIEDNSAKLIPLVTARDIMEREITDEAYTRLDIGLSFIVKYIARTDSPRTPEENALADEVESLALEAANELLDNHVYRTGLHDKIQDTYRAISAIKLATPDHLPMGLDTESLLKDSEASLDACRSEYDELVATQKARLMELKAKCKELNLLRKETDAKNRLAREVAFLERLMKA